LRGKKDTKKEDKTQKENGSVGLHIFEDPKSRRQAV